MEVHLNCGQFTISVDCSDEKDAFEKISHLQEVFQNRFFGPDGEEDLDLTYKVREADGNKFYELVSKKYKKRLLFGQHKKGGTLFPKEWVDLWQGNGVESGESAEEAPAPAPKKKATSNGKAPF